MRNAVYTIGHSTHPIHRFVALLQQHAIAVIVDVRSVPFSKQSPQYNRDDLKTSLKDAGMRYLFLGNELGARTDDPNCYVRNKVQYERLSQTPLFQSGIDRVLRGADSYRMALMCAERDPLDCHRTILVSRELVTRGADIHHILPDGKVESHADSMNRLALTLRMSDGDFFRSQEDLYAACYAIQGEKIAYERSPRRSSPNAQE